jgi:hypothetical protein
MANVDSGRRKVKNKFDLGRGKGIMISGFLTPGGILKVPDHLSDEELLSDPTWPKDGTGKPVREALHYFEYGKDNYWKMVEHTARVAVPHLQTCLS